jgi:hypothetical protein
LSLNYGVKAFSLGKALMLRESIYSEDFLILQ